MCREKGPKYRRCPSCEPARRSAYRKAYTAAMAGHPIGTGGTGTALAHLGHHLWCKSANVGKKAEK